jgi:DNA-binding beta-propeller fold protein YncE
MCLAGAPPLALRRRGLGLGDERGSNSVLRLNPVSGRARSIHVSGRPAGVSVGTGSIWVTSADGGLTRIDPGTEEATTIDISGRAPIPIDVAVDDRLVYVAALHCQFTADPYEALLVRVDGSSLSAIPVPAHQDPASSVVALNGSLWITAGGEGVWKVDPATGKVLKRVTLGLIPGELAADEDGMSVWVTAGSGGQVGWAIRIDASTGRIVSRQPIGCCPGAIAVGQGYVWVTNSRDGTVQRISETTGDVVQPVTVGRGVNGVVVGQGGVWVTVDS